MARSYQIKNGTTYSVMAVDKVSCVIKLTATNGNEIEFRHEIESEVPGTPITAERINAVAAQLLIDWDTNQQNALPEPVLVFNEPIVVPENPANP